MSGALVSRPTGGTSRASSLLSSLVPFLVSLRDTTLHDRTRPGLFVRGQVTGPSLGRSWGRCVCHWFVRLGTTSATSGKPFVEGLDGMKRGTLDGLRIRLAGSVCRVSGVPQGRPTIAHRFNGG